MNETWQKEEIIAFGHYPQSAACTRDPIEWRILKVDGEQIYITSLYALDAQPLHVAQSPQNGLSFTRPDWENTTLRTWLNSDFIETAFSAEEQKCMAEVDDLKDKVSLLSLDDINDANLFPSDASTGCKSTAYTAALYTDDIEDDRQARAIKPLPPRASYWLKDCCAVIHGDEMVGVEGVVCMRLNLNDKLAVRPVLRLNLAQYERLLKGSFINRLKNFRNPIKHRFDAEKQGSIQIDQQNHRIVADGVGYPDLHLELTISNQIEHPHVLGQCLIAAILGDPKAQNSIGSLLWLGKELAQDYQEAFRWNRYAANQGLPEAMVDLADAYFNSKGVGKDPESGFYWTQKAAKMDLPLGILNLGKCYAWGVGTEQNIDEAIIWLEKASEAGVIEARELLETLK